jgi:flagellar basal-body rod protein FlgC
VTENGKTVEKETSNVDLAEEIPNLMVTKRAYQANLKTIETQDEMLGSLLDTIG